MSSMTTRTIREVCALVVDCPHSTPQWTETGVPVLRSRNIRSGRLDLAAQPSFTSEAEYQRRVRRAVPQAGDLVITREAPMGEICMVPPGLRCCLGQRMVLLRPNERVVDGRYLLFALQSPQLQQAIQAHEGTGSTVSNLRIPSLEALEVPLPPLPEQRRIAAVLGALDDKIELNRQMNRTLEEMAQALFKSWFIDFDGHDDLVESELGLIPRGWEVGGLSSVATNVRDTVDPSSVPDDTPYVGLEHVPRRCVALDSWGRASDAGSTKTRFQRGDTLFGKLRPYFHKVVPAPVDGVSSTDILVIRPKHDGWRWFAFGHLYSDAMVAHATAGADGTRMPRTSWNHLCRFRVALPPKELAADYGRSVLPMFQRIAANVQESRALSTLRDTLLPKLISGEVRVPEGVGEDVDLPIGNTVGELGGLG